MGICLHKAKRKDNGEWVEGYVYRLSEQNAPFIMVHGEYGKSCEIDEETICKSLSIPCSNSDCVWEHDILRAEFDDCECIFVVTYNREKACFMAVVPSEHNYPYNIEAEEFLRYELIGNRFDNPELLDAVTELTDGEYIVRSEIDYRMGDGSRLRIAYNTGITIDGDRAVAAGRAFLNKKDLEPDKSCLKRVR